MTVDTYTIQIMFGDGPYQELDPLRVALIMAETEENLTDLLPPGYYARIRKWNDPGPEENEDDA